MSSELNNSLTTVAKGAGIVFAGMIAGNVLGMVNQVVLGRFLGPEDYGLFNLALSVVMISSTIALFGFFGSLSRFVPYHLKRKEHSVVRSVIDFSFIFVLSTSVLLAAIIYIMAAKIAVAIFHDARLVTVLRIFAIAVPVTAITQVTGAVTRGFKAPEYDALVFKIGNKVLKIIIFFVFVIIGSRLYGALLAYILGGILTIIISWTVIRRKLFPDYKQHRKVTIAKEILSFSWPLSLTGVTFIFVSKTDKILLGYYLTSKEVGIYSPALVIASLMVFVSMAFKYIFLPTVSEYFSRNNLSSMESLFKSTSKWIFLIVFPIFIFILIFSRDILTLLFGSEYAGGYLALIILSLGISVNVFAGTAGNILVGGGRTRMNLVCEIIAAVCNIVLNIILIPRFGITGAALGTGFSYLSRNITSLSFVYRTFGIHPYKKNDVSIVISGFIAAALTFLFKIYSPLSWLPTMIILGIVFLGIYIAAVILTRCFDENDKVILEAVEKKTGINLNFIKKYV